MKIGLCSANGGACTRPGVLARVARQAEASGFESLWVSEHLVVSDPRTPPSPMDPTDPILEPVASLAFVAGCTTSLGLGTGVIVLPLRNPLILAKEIATLDVLSRGRVLVGIGVGYVEREFAALNVPFDRRGERADEYLDAIRAIWTAEHPAFDGELYAFGGVQARPRPLQRPHPPIVVGGWSTPALRRAASKASGWYGWGMDPDETAATLARLRAVLEDVERDPALGDLEITMTPPGPVDIGSAKRYRALGVHRLNIALPNTLDEDGLLRFVERTAEGLVA
jgi:probable F420-dependent oxidoreductase